MTRNLAARIERLEAAKRSPSKIIGILNYCDSQGWPQWDGVHRPGIQIIGVIGGVRTPREDWPEVCATQQAELQQTLRGYAKLLNDEPQAVAPPAFVGTAKEAVAPWPENRKRPKFVEIDGIGEIEIAKFKGLTRK